jgi:predicted nucleic acid-binding protein
MREFVLDANALVRYFRGQEGAEKVDGLLARADKGETRLSISVVNLTEVLYVTARYVGMDAARAKVQTLHSLVEYVPADGVQAESVARIRFDYKLGIADSFAAALAMDRKATLVTADPEFARLGKQLKIMALPQHSK